MKIGWTKSTTGHDKLKRKLFFKTAAYVIPLKARALCELTCATSLEQGRNLSRGVYLKPTD